MNPEIVYSVTDFVAIFNQSITYAYPKVVIVGEVSDFRVSKNRWVYFSLKDEHSIVKFFGTIYQLAGPVEEGMMLKVSGAPQLHPKFGFSITISSISLVGEGVIKRAAALLKQKLEGEGLFSAERKRLIAYPPKTIGLITSRQSAAYSDFIKVLDARFGGIEISHYDVQVQGEDAPVQITGAIEFFNSQSKPVDVLVITRGGGSTEDLQVFSNELVVRAVASSRIPSLVAIGHERDISLAEQAADKRASTPSNAAELLVPDRANLEVNLDETSKRISSLVNQILANKLTELNLVRQGIVQSVDRSVTSAKHRLVLKKQLIDSIKPSNILKKGYVIVRKGDKSVGRSVMVSKGNDLTLEFYDGQKQVRAM